MIKPPSISADWTFIFSGDPALTLPEDETERERVLKQARDTGDWSPLLGADQPTLFHLGQVTRDQQEWCLTHANHAGHVNGLELQTLGIRVALRRVENFGPYQVKRTKHSGSIYLADMEIINALQLVSGGSDIITEMFNAIWERANPPRPL